MRRRDFLTLLGGTAAVAGAAAAFKETFLTHAEAKQSLLIGGSSTMQKFTIALADEFAKLHPNVDIDVEGGGSLAGLIAVKRRAVDVAAMSRDLTTDEDDTLTRNYLIARDSVSIVVNKAQPIVNLDRETVRRLLEGEIANWKEIGGSDAPVTVVSRKSGSITLKAVEEMVLKGGDLAPSAILTNTAVEQANAVDANPFAVGFLALKDADSRLSAVKIDGVPGARPEILTGHYPFTRSFYYTVSGRDNDLALQFVAFARSPAGQRIAEQMHFLPVC